VTPVYARVGRKLVESLPHETVVRDPSALERFPIRPRGYREAIARALANEEHMTVAPRWSDAFSAPAAVDVGSVRWTSSDAGRDRRAAGVARGRRYAGSSTLSIAWMTPFEAKTSVAMMRESFTKNAPPLPEMRVNCPFSMRIRDELVTSAASRRPLATW
jgi:hypothetical protein